MSYFSRRRFVSTSGLVLAGLALPWTVSGAGMLTIHMKSSADGSLVWFDPIGVFVQPGTTLRWVLDGNIHTTTAYHPDNNGHALRIPEGAKPWDSGYMIADGSTFDVTLTVPGVYDYFCAPHEFGGMVGRIVVGEVSGPGARAFDESISEKARCAFPAAGEIVSQGTIPASEPLSC